MAATTNLNTFASLDFNDMMDDKSWQPTEHIEAKQLLRNIKLDIALGKIPFKPNKNLVETPIWDICKELSDDGFVIGGSVILKLYNMIEFDRYIGDIDVFTKEAWKESINNYSVINSQDYDDDEHHTKFKRVKISTNHFSMHENLTLDIFEKEVPSVIYDGVNIASPLKAYDYKLKYWRGKDYYDFKYLEKQYNKWLGIYEFDCDFNNEFLGS